MAGRKKRRERLERQSPNYGARWCDRPEFTRPSVGSPETTIYLLCTPHGYFTVYEEYVCWLAARGEDIAKAFRKVYWPFKRTGRQSVLTPKMKKRVQDLIEMGERGYIDLNSGPWKHFKIDIGNPEIMYKNMPKDFSNVGLT